MCLRKSASFYCGTPYIYESNCSICYIYTFREVSELVVSIIQARDLTANQYTGSLDTYIRGVLLPDSESRFQTKVG